MDKILEMASKNGEYMIISIFALVIAIIITIVLNFSAKNLKFVKYIPGIILISIGIFALFTVINDIFNPANIQNLVVFVIGCASGIVSLLVALIIGILQKN
ncbi:MAG: cytochrome C biosynthesis protein [Peptoniphilaceae bacterium]